MSSKPNTLQLGRSYLYVSDFFIKFHNIDVRKDDMVFTLKKMEKPKAFEERPLETFYDCTFEFRSGGSGMARIYGSNISQEEQFIILDHTYSTRSILIPLDDYGIDMAKKIVRAMAYRNLRCTRSKDMSERISNNEKALIDIIKG